MSEADPVRGATARNLGDLLVAAAKFVERDPGSAGFLDRFAQAVQAPPKMASQLLDQVLAARERTGNARFTLGPGDLEMVTTSAGATLTACALPGPGGALAASVRLTDAARHPVSAAALRVAIGGREDVFVTDPGGQVSISGIGRSVEIAVGEETAAVGHEAAASGAVIRLPRALRRDHLDLAAADEAETAAEEAGTSRWPIAVGSAEFWGMERERGYDLTILVEEISGTLADGEGAHAVAFTTLDRGGNAHAWVVPLAPGPRALSGTLYGTDADAIRKDSVTVGDGTALLPAFGEDFDEVIRRSVLHADTGSAWRALARRLPPGPLRESVNDALARRAGT